MATRGQRVTAVAGACCCLQLLLLGALGSDADEFQLSPQGRTQRSVLPRSRRRSQALAERGRHLPHNGSALSVSVTLRAEGTGEQHAITTATASSSSGGNMEQRGGRRRGGLGKPIMRRIRRRRGPAGFIAAYANGTNSPRFTVEGNPPSMGSLLALPIEMKLDYDTCARRTYEPQTTEPSAFSGAKLGIVVVVCNEDLSWVRTIPGSCQDKHLYLYSKCGVDEAQLLSAVGGKLSRCTTVQTVKHTVVTDLTHVKMHADYLRHITARYDDLEPHLVFLKARVGDKKRMGVMRYGQHGQYDSPRSVSQIIKTALQGNWAYLNVWPNRIHGTFEKPVSRGRELCLWYKRYTCETECYTCQGINHPLCYIPQSKSMFIVSRARVRSLPKSEYVALHQWLVSYKDSFAGWLGHRRRYVMERLWPSIFGCHQDIHRFPTSYSAPAGCKENDVFGDPQEHQRRAGHQPGPPQELVELGHITWPQPSYLANMPYFPHIYTRQPIFSIVSALANASHADGQRTSFKAALLANPDAKLVLLLDRGDGAVDKTWHVPEWAGRVTVIKLSVPAPPLADADDAERLNKWKAAALQAQYLTQLASSSQDTRDSTGHLVFVRPHTMFYRGVRDVFQKQAFTVAVSLQPLQGREARHAQLGYDLGTDLDLSTWFVHKDAVAEGAAVMGAALAHYRHSVEASFKAVLAECFQGAVAYTRQRGTSSEASAGPSAAAPMGAAAAGVADEGEEEEAGLDEVEEVVWQSSARQCQLEDGTPATVLLLPCELFNADRAECPPDVKAKVASVIRSVNNNMTLKMWGALQKRSRGSIINFFTTVRAVPLHRQVASARNLRGPILTPGLQDEVV
mmetsp:Transcript_486/g.1310  ORF Transcript_486/g.1310 Transcript_486/m.1310 type:complete len:851 (-) Transcript_486:487-3039(-)